MAKFNFFYPSSSASANASVGLNGQTAPTSATEVAGINPSGNLQPLQTDASGSLITTPATGSVQHVIVDSSALPSGASTSALQTSGNASLTSIDGKTPALGQALAAASVPVVLTAAQLSTLTPPTSVTVVQPTGTNLHAVIDNFPATQPISGTVTVVQPTGTNLHAVVDASALPTGAATEATLAKLPVAQASTTSGQSGPLAQGAVTTAAPTYTAATTNPLSLTTAGALRVDASGSTAPLPTGAATAALQSSVQGAPSGGTAATSSNLAAGIYRSSLLTLTNGQQAGLTLDVSGKLLVSTSPSSDVLPATSNITVVDSGSTSTAYYFNQIWYSGTPTVGSVAVFSLPSVETGMVQISGTWTGTLQFEISVDGGTTWLTHSIHQIGSSNFVTTVTNNFVGSLNLAAKTSFRVRATAAVTGTAVVRIIESVNSSTVYVANSIKLTDGAASAAPVTATIKAASTAPVAADTALVVGLSPNSSGIKTGGTAIANAPVQNIYTSTSITTAAYTQLVASTTAATNSIHIFDSSGQAMILAIGGSGSEVIQLYVPPGGDNYTLNIPVGSRIAYKALSANATSGYLLISFLQ